MSFHRNPWVAAEDRYLDGLNAEDTALYKRASAKNLLYSTSAAQIRHENNSRSRAASKKLQPLIAAITQYGSALDVVSNTAPLFFSPVWGALRVLLHIASEFDKYYGKLVEMLERIGNAIPTFESYERLFPNHEQLLYSLSAAYLDIITFCTDAKGLFQKAKKKKSQFSLPGNGLRVLKLVWKPFERDFGATIERFRLHTRKVEIEAQLAHMIEQAVERREQGNERDAQALERTISETERQRQLLLHKEQLRDNLLKKLSQCDQDYKHRIMKKIRVEGTGKWLLSSDEFGTWRNGIDSSCLWCHGIQNSGFWEVNCDLLRSTSVIDAIRDERLLDIASVAWFYCDYSEPRTLEPSEIVGSLIKQLLTVRLLTMSIDLQIQLEKIYENGRVPDTDELFDMFFRVIRELPKVFIIIDGLDECKEKERGPLLQWIKALSKSRPTPVKLFIASREEIDIQKAITGSPSIQTTGHNVSSDIADVVKDLVRTRVLGERNWSQDPVLVQEIADALIAGARGMFLWATLQLDDICEELSEDGVRRVLKRLPDGLNGTFIRALQKIKARGPTQIAAAQKLFMWLVGGKRNLTVEELKEAVSVAPGDSDIRKRRIPDDLQLIRACGSLVVYDPEENTLRLAHYTVRQFLLSQPSEIELSLHLPNFHTDINQANVEIGQICMTYICFSTFETQVVRRTLKHLSVSDTRLLRTGTSRWVPQMAGFSRAQTTAWNLFRGRMFSSTGPTPDINFTKHLFVVKKPAKDFKHDYKFLDYVIEFWIDHAVSFTPEQPRIWKQFENVALERKLSFNFRPWLTQNPSNCSDTQNAFRWALENTHEPLMSLVLNSTKYEWSFLNSALENNEHALCFASRMGHEQTVETLLPAFSDSLDSGIRTCTESLTKSIKLATLHGHISIATKLLTEFQELEALRPGGPMDEVFKMAIECGHSQILTLLRDKFGFRIRQKSTQMKGPLRKPLRMTIDYCL